MSIWTENLTKSRLAKAREVYDRLSSIDWKELTEKDRTIHDILGHLCLDLDEMDLLDLCDVGFEELD